MEPLPLLSSKEEEKARERNTISKENPKKDEKYPTVSQESPSILTCLQ